MGVDQATYVVIIAANDNSIDYILALLKTGLDI